MEGRSLLAFLFSLLLVSCVAERSTRIGGGDPKLRRVELEKQWSVELDGRRVGVLKRFRYLEEAGFWYEVSRPSGQLAGTMDHRGRAFRLEPFAREPVFLGQNPMAENLRILLELESRPEIRPFERERARPGKASPGGSEGKDGASP